MRRFLIVVAAAAAMALVASPALAKGQEGDFVSGSAVIAGPGLRKPLIIDHPLGDETSWQFRALLEASGLGSGFESGWYDLAQDRSKLGSGYTIDWAIRMEGRTWVLHQVMYPFATGRPWFYTPPGQLFGNRRIAAWWSASPGVLGTLQGLGFPRTGPPLVPEQAPPPGSRALPQAGDARSWVWAATVGGFLLLVALGAMSGRRRREQVVFRRP
jgi:LPXTG-motif cell wall-anchored protein